MLRGWFAIEVLLFMATLFSNIIFVLVHQCSKIRIRGTRNTALVHQYTDLIEEQQILVCLFCCFIAPYFVTAWMQSFGFAAYPELSNRVWEFLFNLGAF